MSDIIEARKIIGIIKKAMYRDDDALRFLNDMLVLPMDSKVIIGVKPKMVNISIGKSMVGLFNDHTIVFMNSGEDGHISVMPIYLFGEIQQLLGGDS